MKTLAAKIEESINQNVRVYFISEVRKPVFGRFLKEDDFEHLKSKGMFRFKLLQNLGNKDLSKIYDSAALYDIVVYPYKEYE